MKTDLKIYRNTYKCLCCDREIVLMEKDNICLFLNDRCCTYHKSVRILSELLDDPTWEQIKEAYGSG